MFYCEKCRKRNDWPEGFRKSLGPCELCKKVAPCNDVNCAQLPPPKRKRKSSTRNRHKTWRADLKH